MSTMVIESHPLVRLGMQRMLERMPGVGAVRSLEPSAVMGLRESPEEALVLFGMSEDATDNWYLLRRLHQAMPNARILLLSDNMWLRVPSSLQTCGVVEHLPKSASIERMEAAIRNILEDDYMPLPMPGRHAWEAVQHQ
ncbi:MULTISPECIES: response regulator transcription factor [Cupriavidus]|uniref:response regulator transcription factor n=1 Tax=Cupriavidus TaxID=106589 RepID=UPI00168AAC7F|nr:response regulator transcription factor [Cupriavidus pauculus]